MVAIAAIGVLLAAATDSSAQAIRLQWDWNPEPEVAGYVVYVGTRSRAYDQSFDVGHVDRFSFTPPQPGQTYFFAVRAYFPGPILGAYSAEVSSGANAPPHLANPGSQSHQIGQQITVLLDGGDPQGQAVTYEATGLPPGLLLTRSLGRIDGTPTTPGVYDVTATVSDGVLTASQTFTWTIRATPITPATQADVTDGQPPVAPRRQISPRRRRRVRRAHRRHT